MLAAAFAGWLKHLSERGFDESFVCLLRANGYFDIHFRHGQFEFGKDFAAKRREDGGVTQYGFQSKAGDIGGSEWSSIFSQLDELTSGRLSPAGFDPTLPRRSILVTTGRLVGKAPMSAQEFTARVQERGDGDFAVWERDDLIEAAEGGARFPIAPSRALIQILAHIESGASSDRTLESHLGELVDVAQHGGAPLYRALLDNSACGALLVDKDRPLQQLTVALNAIRIAATRAHYDEEEARSLVRLSFSSYIEQGDSGFRELLNKPNEPAIWLAWCKSTCGHIVTYPLLCTRVLEFLGLKALWTMESDSSPASPILDLIETVLGHQPGVHHPISDRSASSFAPALLALHRQGRVGSIRNHLRQTATWLFDRYEAYDSGLAGPHSTPDEEVRVLLAPSFEAVTLSPRRESLLAVAVADLAYYVATDIYADIVNDMKAVGIVPTALHADDSAEAYVVAKIGATKSLLNIRYPDTVAASPLPHHLLQRSARIPERVGGIAVVLALACLTRDRLFSDCYARSGFKQ